jgi:hypothetical protein
MTTDEQRIAEPTEEERQKIKDRIADMPKPSLDFDETIMLHVDSKDVLEILVKLDAAWTRYEKALEVMKEIAEDGVPMGCDPEEYLSTAARRFLEGEGK